MSIYIRIKKLSKYHHNANIALDSVFANKFRSILTALGIIFGVAAVIAMMAIGNGAQKEILEQIKLIGVNNIIITPKIKENKQTETTNNFKNPEKFSPGLTLLDADAIKKQIPSVLMVSPEVIYDTYIMKDGISKSAKITGVSPDYFSVFNLKLQEGQMFSEEQLANASPVCIIGPAVKSKFFSTEDALDKWIKCGKIWLKVIGVLNDLSVTKKATDSLGVSDYNNDIYTPIQTLLIRYKDRSFVNATTLKRAETSTDESSTSTTQTTGENLNQLDKIIVQVKESDQLLSTTEIISRMLKRRHSDIADFSIKVPQDMIDAEQKTKKQFNIVLIAIASISLIVGGVGIMNIMLASVMERTKEIGIRLAIGATKKDVIYQFLSEAVMISITGGILGIILGIVLSKLITQFFDILTIISIWSILVSFGVSVTIGIIFGYMPAKKAALNDPVLSLRYE